MVVDAQKPRTAVIERRASQRSPVIQLDSENSATPPKRYYRPGRTVTILTPRTQSASPVPAKTQSTPMPKMADEIEKDYLLFQQLDRQDPFRMKLERRLASKAAAIEQLNGGRKLSEKEAFAALWRSMQKPAQANALSRDIQKAAELQMAQQASHAAAAATRAHEAHERRNEDRQRRHQTRVMNRAYNIRRNLETADAPELVQRAKNAQALKEIRVQDPKLQDRARQVSAAARNDVVKEASSRIPGRTSPTKDLEKDLKTVVVKEQIEKDQLNRGLPGFIDTAKLLWMRQSTRA